MNKLKRLRVALIIGVVLAGTFGTTVNAKEYKTTYEDYSVEFDTDKVYKINMDSENKVYVTGESAEKVFKYLNPEQKGTIDGISYELDEDSGTIFLKGKGTLSEREYVNEYPWGSRITSLYNTAIEGKVRFKMWETTYTKALRKGKVLTDEEYITKLINEGQISTLSLSEEELDNLVSEDMLESMPSGNILVTEDETQETE